MNTKNNQEIAIKLELTAFRSPNFATIQNNPEAKLFVKSVTGKFTDYSQELITYTEVRNLTVG
jgi:hypothetical protein